MSHFADQCRADLGRTVTDEAGDAVRIHPDPRAVVLSVARRLSNQPLAAMQPLADELSAFGIDISNNPEHLRALSVLVTCARHEIKPSETALAALCGEAA